MKLATLFAFLQPAALVTGAGVLDKCPSVTLPEVSTSPGGSGGGSFDDELGRCFKGCLALGEGCTSLEWDHKHHRQVYPPNLPGHVTVQRGSCVAGMIGPSVPKRSMLSSLIVHPMTDTTQTRTWFIANPPDKAQAMFLVKTRNFYNLFRAGHFGITAGHSWTKEFPETRPKFGIAHHSYMSGAFPMLQGRTLFVGFLALVRDGIKDHKPTGFHKSQLVSIGSTCHRTTYDRDTHMCRVTHSGNDMDGIVRYCTKIWSPHAQLPLNSVAKHGPANDCIRIKVRGLGRHPKRFRFRIDNY